LEEKFNLQLEQMRKKRVKASAHQTKKKRISSNQYRTHTKE